MARITIIDDDVDQAQDIKDILGGNEHAVSMLHRVEGALEILARDKPDLVILDVMFPENPSAGMELAIKIRQNPETRRMPVLLLTSVNQEFPLGLSDKDIDPDWLPIQAFIEKPVAAKPLLSKVGALLGRSKA